MNTPSKLVCAMAIAGISFSAGYLERGWKDNSVSSGELPNGMPVRVVHGFAYTFECKDRAAVVIFHRAKNGEAYLADGPCFRDNFVTKVENVGTGSITLTAQKSTINGVASWVLMPGEKYVLLRGTDGQYSTLGDGGR